MIQVAIEEYGLYNNGILACKWWTAEDTIEDITAYYQALRKEHGIFPHDDLELFNADWEGSSLITECTSFKDIQSLNDILEALSDTDKKKIDYLMDWNGCSFDEALEQYESIELYEDMTMQDLAWQFIEETWEVPEHLINYIDADMFARELEMDYTVINNDIFRSA